MMIKVKIKFLLKRTLFVGTLQCFVFTGLSQEKMVLNLEQAKKHAVEYNRDLQKAGISIEEAQESLWQTVSKGLPQIDATVDYSNYLGFDMQFGGQSIAFNPTSNAKVTLSQLIFSGSYWVGIDMAKIAKNIAEKNVVKTELDVKENVTNSYYSILLAIQTQNILKQNLESMREIHRRTEDMVKMEMLEKTNAEQIRIQVLNLEALIHSINRNITMGYNMLRLQLGVSPDVEIELLGNVDSEIGESSIRELYNRSEQNFSVENNISFQMLKSQEELQLKQISMDKMAYLPTISGFYSYTYKLKKPAFDMSPANVIGFQANIPIFSSFNRRSKLRQSKIQLKSLQKDIEQIEDQLSIQEKQLRFNLMNAYEQFNIQQENVKVSKLVFENASSKHEYGLISALDLTTAHSNYLQAENSLITAKNDLLKAQTELCKLLEIL
ncbi:MAG: TolC family protein [Prevotellaceae bacterium]|jgi:outer membrane protein TolC|nr:TolC family protein [Prevotellaceae bacterium]